LGSIPTCVFLTIIIYFIRPKKMHFTLETPEKQLPHTQWDSHRLGGPSKTTAKTLASEVWLGW